MQNHDRSDKPLLVITGAAGNLGGTLVEGLAEDHRVIGLDRDPSEGEGTASTFIELDITSQASVDCAFDEIRRDHGSRIAAVVHLTAYFDFSGEEDEKYDAVNLAVTRRLLNANCTPSF